jgi:AraC family transcriptional regulator, regulatory protein of adaptative response / methylated-DNA-[protein]-cysteine methyltransferase
MSLQMDTARTSQQMSEFVSDDARWNAVCRRDRSADGAFVIAVLTTGVFCLPSCAARRPLRENVRFYAGSAEAERAGFRPCKSYRPNEVAFTERQSVLVAKACRLIEEADEPPSLNALARAAGVSRFHFHRVFKAATGVTPKAYTEAYRARRVREKLDDGDTVTAAIYGAGFNSNGRFYAASNGLLGMTPTQLRAGGGGTVIRFAVGQTSLGDSEGRLRHPVRRRPGRASEATTGPFPECRSDRRRQ